MINPPDLKKVSLFAISIVTIKKNYTSYIIFHDKYGCFSQKLNCRQIIDDLRRKAAGDIAAYPAKSTGL